MTGPSSRDRVHSGSGHGASLFTGDLLARESRRCGLASSFAKESLTSSPTQTYDGNNI